MRRGRIAFLAVLMLGIVLMFAGCGNKDGKETSITSDDAAFAMSAVGESFDAVMFALEMNTSGGSLAPAFKSSTIDGTESDPERLKAAVDALVDRFNVSSIAGAVAIQQAPVTEDCSVSGTVTYETIESGNTIEITVIFDNCVEGGTTTNGSLTINITGETEFTIVFDNFSSTRRVDGNVVESFSADLTISGTVTLDVETGYPTGFTLTLDGSIEYTSDSNPSDSFSVTYTDFVITMSEDADNMVSTINGTVASPCLGGAVTFETITPIVIPPVEDGCPIAGVVKITRGSSTATLTFTSTGGVEIDLDSDGTVDASYPSCDDVPEICSH